MLAASSPQDHEVIDVGSNGPVLFEGRERRALTLDGAGIQTHYAVKNNDRDEGHEHDKEEDEDESETTEGEEHEYRHGRQAIPMESPGEEMRSKKLMMDDQIDGDSLRGVSSVGIQRLRRLRGRRGFFHSDTDVRSFHYRSSGGILQRFTLRKRKREEHDLFWTTIGVLTLLSFALMCCITIYLTQSDFFESHQNDLFGTTVDNRFTVVAQDDADIFLKSGYSNSRFSEGMISFNHGKLRVGRRSLKSGEKQKFYGVSFSLNGTASFTNKVESPMVEADYLSARKGVMFDDGTMMTTAAESSGGAEEQGDLNLVSKAGSVVTSAGGNSLLFVDPSGTVTVANTKSDEPMTSGITLDGTRGQISIGSAFLIKHDDTSLTLSTPQTLHLESSSVFVGTSAGGKVRVSVPGIVGRDGSEGSEGDGTRVLELVEDVEESESVTLEVAGQSSLVQKEGGDIRIVGGDGLNVGGDVTLIGGQATKSGSEYGSIAINAGLDQTDSSFTEIGSHGLAHEVNIHGLVTLNHKAGVNDTTKVKVGGGFFNVSSQRIILDNQATSLSELHVNSNDVHLGSTSPSVRVGKAGLSTIKVQGVSTVLDATKDVTIGEKASSIVIGETATSGQTINVKSGKVAIASEAISMSGKTSITGGSLVVQSSKVDIGGESTSEITIGAPKAKVDVGSQAEIVSIGVDSLTVNIGSDASVVNLSGKVMISGKPLDSRRLARRDDVSRTTRPKPFGYLNADRIAVAVAPIEALTSFVFGWDDGFSSETHLYQVDPNQERMLTIASVSESDDEVDSGHLQVSLYVSSVVLVAENAAVQAQTSKIRCRIYRHAAERADTIAVEVGALVEHCYGITCEDGIFLGLQGQRIVPYNSGDSFSAQCTLASTASGELLLQGVQCSFTEQ